MDIIAKFKETLISVLPIMAVVVFLNFTISPLGENLVPFLIGGVFLIIGLSLFLSGTDIGMTAVGEKLGSVLARSHSVGLILGIGFIVGFGVTFAEPDVNVLAKQVHAMNPMINERLLVFLIAVGLGVFVDIGLLRILYRIDLKKVLIVFYGIIFAIVCFAGQSMASISFDASGATTGPLAVPFLLAIGLGVASASNTGEDSSFGLTGIASIGPVLAVGCMALMFSNGSASLADGSSAEVSKTLGTVFVEMTKKTAIGFGPLAVLIIIFQYTLMHFPKIKFRRICLGIIYSFVGIVLFLAGVEYGFTEVGFVLGKNISLNYPSFVPVIIAVVLGAIVVCAEPAVWILTKQIEDVTAGRIKRSLVMVFLCVGVASAVGLGIVRIIYHINFLWFVFIGVGTALVLSLFCPPLFTGMAFDSGGVASGPMSTSFLLSFALGTSTSADMGFGLVGLIAIAPLVAIQILGIIFRIKEYRAGYREKQVKS